MKVRPKLKKLRRHLYGMRSLVPGLRRRHRLEAMVGPLGYWRQLQEYHLQAVTRLGLQPHHSFLDIGCGPLQGGIGFVRYLERGRYVGIDQNPLAIQVGHEEISRHRLAQKNPRLFVSHEFGDDRLGAATFDFIWMSQVLYYFDQRKMHSLFEMAGRRLQRHGMMAGDILGPDSDRSFLRHPLPPRHTPESVDRLATEHGLRVVVLGTLHAFGYPKRLGLGTNILLRISRA